MFEIEVQEKSIGSLKVGGKFKVYNVTQARANFKDVLQNERDPGTKVVITRHGRPLKVLLDYEEYMELLSAAGQDEQEITAPHLEETEDGILKAIDPDKETASSPAKALPPKWVQRESKAIADALRSQLK